MDKIINCIECTLPVKEYKQNEQVQEDVCEYCFIANVTENSDKED